jgi:CHAT domain-containing protein/tetratricopeptide (TPR) repeat protein
MSGLIAALLLGCASTLPVAPLAETAPAAESARGLISTGLKVGIAAERQLPSGGQDEIPVDLKAARFVRFSIVPAELNLVLSLLGPNGETVAKVEGSDRLTALTAATGRHRLGVTSRAGEASSRYKVLLEEVRPIRPEDGTQITAEAALSAAFRSRSAGDYEKAIAQAQEALCRWRGDRSGEFRAFYEMGSLYFAMLRKEEAAQWYGEALQTALATGDRTGAARASNALGTVLIDPHAVEARGYFELALSLSKEMDDVAQQAKILYALGVLSANLGKSEEALASYRHALSFVDPMGSLSLKAEIWNGMGALYSARGESKEALECYQRALEIAKEAKTRGAEAAILTGLGQLYRRRGEPQKALATLQDALDINRQIKDRSSECRVRNHLGPVYMDLGQPDKALGEYERALEVLRSGDGNERWVANTLLNIGQVDLSTNRLHEALDRFEEALKASRQAGGARDAVAMHYIGVAQLKLHQTQEAIQSLESALALRRQAEDRPGEASTLLELGKAYKTQGDPDRAAPLMREALQLANEVGASFTQAASHFELARLERERGDLAEALIQIKRAIDILESVRSDLSDDRLRSSFFSSKRSYYDFYVDLLMQLDRGSPGQGYAEKAFAASEMGRARSLLDLLAEGRLDLTRGIDPILKQKESEVMARLSQIQRQLMDELSKSGKKPNLGALRARLDEVEDERQKLELKIRTEHPLYATVRYPSSLQLQEIQQRLDGDSALLEYSLGEEATYLFVVTRESFRVHPLPLSHEIAELVRTVRTELGKPGLTTFSYIRAAQRLHDILIAPARPDFAGKHRLLIAPDGALHFLSFEAMLTGKPRGGGSLPYLLREFSISYIPSASVLSSLSLPRNSLAAGKEPPKQFLAFADPDYGSDPAEVQATTANMEIERGPAESGPLPRLEGTEREVSLIASRYPAAEVQIYRRREANEENVKNNELVTTARRIHFATHGVIDEERPEFSGLALTRTDNPDDDGFLRVYEIFNLNLNADLVVLSGCETGLGEEVTGEGLVGLTRAFLYAGTPSVVVSLWRVADAAAPDLMVQFYENLERSSDKAEALRQAKLAMVQKGGKYARPYYWAPFVLVGAPD